MSEQRLGPSESGARASGGHGGILSNRARTSLAATIAINMAVRRYRITLSGAVQGVGLRPFVYNLAHSLDLGGFVRNTADAVEIEVEGQPDRLDNFTLCLGRDRPRAARVTSEHRRLVPPNGDRRFRIAASDAAAATPFGLLNDLATCAECLQELLDPSDRRYEYPFITCTACGPRFTISEALPYDRVSTTMRAFEMCEQCAREYATPHDRRFHAQPNACAVCGPRLSMEIADVADAIRRGAIIALKGIGGFQLLCNARSEGVVELLRARKAREFKPFAVMMPTLDVVGRYCEVSVEQAEVLTSPAAPIVLLRPRTDTGLAVAVSGRSPWLGVMLPNSPVHHLLLRRYSGPVVATSGNIAGEPIVIDEDEARRRLGSIADVMVTHDRPIARPCDDSVVRVGRQGLSPVRRARGYAPLPIRLARPLARALAVGGHLKNTIAIGIGDTAIVSQHVGDLDGPEARNSFERTIAEFEHLHRFTPELVVADLHPDYASTLWAERSGHRVLRAQHHEAHVASCAAENGVMRPYLGVAWDGTGYGRDGSIWGGEFFVHDGRQFTRVAHLRPFPLLGGEAATREGWRAAVAMDWTIRGRAALEHLANADVFERMLRHRVNSPDTTSMGRLFDAIAAVSGVATSSRFEGEAAMALEAAVDDDGEGAYPFGEGLEGDWAPLFDSVSRDVQRHVGTGRIAARFHLALAQWTYRVATAVGIGDVVLSGGVFQNAFLVDRCVDTLSRHGFTVHTHHQVPPNDGGLSLGQLALAPIGE
jgi:hydrogenase maturation protein HypF